ncbi:MAG: dephospho-CoA kinase [Bacteroidota bacterium]
MISIGVTGGIGSGKTTFCKRLEECGAYVAYADDVAKTLMVTDRDLISGITSVFGEQAYQPDGSLNRAYLAKEAFQKNRVSELNALVHPVLWRYLDALVAQKRKEGCPLFVKEAAILLQHGRPDHVDVVVLLLADETLRVRRVMERDKQDQQAIEARVTHQPDFNALVNFADVVIENAGSVSDLEDKADELYYRYADRKA